MICGKLHLNLVFRQLERTEHHTCIISAEQKEFGWLDSVKHRQCWNRLAVIYSYPELKFNVTQQCTYHQRKACMIRDEGITSRCLEEDSWS